MLPPVGTRVEVYWNLHCNCYSVRAAGPGGPWRVVAHCASVYLDDVTFVVRPGGRARVVATGRKNVHAFMRGNLSRPAHVLESSLTPSPAAPPPVSPPAAAVTYDPYRWSSFVRVGDHTPVHQATSVAATTLHGHAVLLATQAR